MRILDTVQRLYPYQQRMLDADIPAEAMLEWCRRPHRCVRLVTSRPSVGDAVRGYSSRAVLAMYSTSTTRTPIAYSASTWSNPVMRSVAAVGVLSL